MGLKALRRDLTVGTVTNVTASAPLASSGGATPNITIDLLSPGVIGSTTPNFLYGLNKEIYKTANADSPLTGPQCSGTIVSNYGMTDADCTIALPTAAEGYGFLAILPAVRARFFKFQAGASDKIYLSGTAGSDNGHVGVASGYAAGAACSFFTFKDTDGGFDWFAVPVSGTWVAS